ncbi:MAG: hypothetical protein ACK53Y_21445, partial [bacterium]
PPRRQGLRRPPAQVLLVFECDCSDRRVLTGLRVSADMQRRRRRHHPRRPVQPRPLPPDQLALPPARRPAHLPPPPPAHHRAPPRRQRPAARLRQGLRHPQAQVRRLIVSVCVW